MKIGKGALVAALLLALGAVAVSAQAAGYPEKPVRIVVPFPPGGSTDFTARVAAEQLQKILGQPFVVENKVGNFGINAIQELVNADGYTLMVGSVITNSVTPVLFRKKMSFDYDRAIMPVSRLVAFPWLFVTRTAHPANTLKDFLEDARRSGRKLKVGNDWVGSTLDFDALALSKLTGIEMASTPSPGGALGILADVAAGNTDWTFLNPVTGAAAITEGKVKALAVTGPSRLAGFPDVPTMEESGFKGVGTSNWQGLFAPGGTSAHIVRTVHAAAVKAMHSEEARAAFAKGSGLARASASPDQFAAEIREEMANWEKLRRELKLPE